MNEQEMRAFAVIVATQVVAILRQEHLLSETLEGEAFPEPVTIGSLVLDFRAQRVTQNGVVLNIKRRDFATFAYLVQQAGTALTRERLLAAVWPDRGENVVDRVVDVTIRRLRVAIGDEAATVIKTVHGVGYMVEKPAK